VTDTPMTTAERLKAEKERRERQRWIELEADRKVLFADDGDVIMLRIV
jgi:hypothetical protein